MLHDLFHAKRGDRIWVTAQCDVQLAEVLGDSLRQQFLFS